ncbi:hypothetical protein THAOC_11592 [Thalassiosira oceanica]|uniref:Uncharacterized protein n=1 Tax=Thalassiosira oceanica TaxID=159749 RepID=K0SM52_THAOC|nr:hypothetical protein THAOC_11592 [Thalassiosira oceanica]|eukprot:EJK67383.1 hypothetical protein THAOC_11592 [Thalassiosira oceanica]
MVFYAAPHHFGFLRSADLPCFALVLWLRIVVQLGKSLAGGGSFLGLQFKHSLGTSNGGRERSPGAGNGAWTDLIRWVVCISGWKFRDGVQPEERLLMLRLAAKKREVVTTSQIGHTSAASRGGSMPKPPVAAKMEATVGS